MKASTIRFQLASLVLIAFCACSGGNGSAADGAAGGATGSGGQGGSGGAAGTGGAAAVGGRGGTGAGGSAGGGHGGAAGSAASGGIGGGGAVDSGTAGSQLQDCTGLICGSNQQMIKVRSPALGTTECACLPLPRAGQCSDCTCGEALCAPYGGHCTGFSAGTGLQCSQNG